MLYGSSHNLGQRAAIPHGGDVGPFRWCYVTCNNSAVFAPGMLPSGTCAELHLLSLRQNLRVSFAMEAPSPSLQYALQPTGPAFPCSAFTSAPATPCQDLGQLLASQGMTARNLAFLDFFFFHGKSFDFWHLFLFEIM